MRVFSLYNTGEVFLDTVLHTFLVTKKCSRMFGKHESLPASE